MSLSPEAQAILRVIADQIKTREFDPNHPEDFLGYQEVHSLLGWSKRPDVKSWGNSLDVQGLGELADWARMNRLPAITGIVVIKHGDDKGKLFQPGGRFYTINNRPKDDIAWWRDQVAKTLAYDWGKHLTPKAVAVPPASVTTKTAPAPQTTVTLQDLEQDEYTSEGELLDAQGKKRLRDGKLRDEAREHFKSRGEWKCSVCTWTPPAGLQSEVLELHHLRPLSQYKVEGEQIRLSEAIKNLAPLCPRCHRVVHSRKGEFYKLQEVKALLGFRETQASGGD